MSLRIGPCTVLLIATDGRVLAKGEVDEVTAKLDHRSGGEHLNVVDTTVTPITGYDRMHLASLRDAQDAKCKRPAWKSPYGPQRK